MSINNEKSVVIYGMGFVGLTLGCVMANNGLKVTGVEPNPKILDSLKNGIPHFYETGLDALLKTLTDRNLIRFVRDNSTLDDIDVHIVAVMTPVDGAYNTDLAYISEASRSIAKKLKKGALVSYRSTIPVGTTNRVLIPILEESGLKAGEDFYVSFAPERTIEGKAIEELQKLPQIIGGFSSECVKQTSQLYKQITQSTVEVDTLEAAEMVKLMNNTYRDLVFSFANEVSNICEIYNINAFRLIDAANEGYPRNPIPKPSPGVGGICLSKDPHLYTNMANDSDYRPVLGKVSRSINEHGDLFVLNKLDKFAKAYGKRVEEMKIYIIGLAFKGMPETSDVRNSMSLKLIEKLPNKKNAYVKDFVVANHDIEALGCHCVNDVMDGFKEADAVLIMNNHFQNNRFNVLDALNLMKKGALFFDGWNMFQPKEIEKINGVRYATMGYMTK